MTKKNEPNCYKCEHRRTIPGDTHSQCKHPHNVAGKLNVSGNPIGIKRGWFNWPFNFDPVWLDNCDGFKEKSGD